MSSQTLFEKFRTAKIMQPQFHLETEEDRQSSMDEVKKMIKLADECKLIRIDRVFSDLSERAMQTGLYFDTDSLSQIPGIVFPYQWIWMECCTGGWRKAVLVGRHQLEDGGFQAVFISGIESRDFPGHLVFPCAVTILWTDREGRITSVDEGPNVFGKDATDGQTGAWHVARAVCYAGILALARMNCKNVELKAPASRSKSSRRVADGSTVWHEIVVTSVPKLKQVSDIAPDGPHRDLRFHWVRGHFADYRKGAGLFGRIRGVFWIPEYTRGSEESGIVEQSYVVQ